MCMYRHNQQCRRPRYETNEYNMESEFNYESEGGYELSPEFGIHDESESESESELENVTNEEEFHNYVKGIVTRDHRSGNLHSVMNHPSGRMAMHHLYNI